MALLIDAEITRFWQESNCTKWV